MFDSGDAQPSLYWSLLLINSGKSAKCFWTTVKTTNKVWFRWYRVIVNHIKLTSHWKLSFNCLTKHFISSTFVYETFISLNFLKLSPLMKSVSFNRIPFAKCVCSHVSPTDLARFQLVASQLDFWPPDTRLL